MVERLSVSRILEICMYGSTRGAGLTPAPTLLAIDLTLYWYKEWIDRAEEDYIVALREYRARKCLAALGRPDINPLVARQDVAVPTLWA